MIMITGGAFQGKTEYVKSRFALGESEISDGKKCEPEALLGAKCVKNYHVLVKRLLQNSVDPVDFTERLCTHNPHIVIIMDEIGCGIIPLEKSERIWREAVGRTGCKIAEHSSEVIRMHCGVPIVIKGDL